MHTRLGMARAVLATIELVSVGGFEPPISCVQDRQGRPGSPTRCISLSYGCVVPGRSQAPHRHGNKKMEHTAGLEPAPSRFVAGSFIQLSYVCMLTKLLAADVKRASDAVNNLAPQPGLEPGSTG